MPSLAALAALLALAAGAAARPVSDPGRITFRPEGKPDMGFLLRHDTPSRRGSLGVRAFACATADGSLPAPRPRGS